jgi:hypothetical protein
MASNKQSEEKISVSSFHVCFCFNLIVPGVSFLRSRGELINTIDHECCRRDIGCNNKLQTDECQNLI